MLALAAIIGFINLGFWQLRRHDERAAVNATIEARAAEEPASLESLLDRFGEDPAQLEYRSVVVRGAYSVGEEVLWQARTLQGRSGHDVLTPLTVGDRSLIVDRGWVPIDTPGPPVAVAAPPAGEVRVVGVIRPGMARGGLGPIDPDTGRLERVSRVDIDRLQRQIDGRLFPFYVLLTDQMPAGSSELPVPQAVPETDPGPHLSYAVQWFVFSLIALIGYPVLLARTARDPEAGGG